MRKAFSLVELSIALVIIGLLVAGVSSGAKLIKQSKINQLISEIEGIVIALNTFQLTYKELPGDIDTAYSYWGSEFGCANSTASVNSTGCNGDGDGVIENTNVANRHEGYRAWQQLGYLELVEGTYSGNYSAGFNCLPGTNTYKTVFDTVGVDLAIAGTMTFGARVANDNCWGGSISPIDVYTIDRKIDDGEASNGKITALNGSGKSNCVASGDYKLTVSSLECRFYRNDAY